jgi:hypothetical protein
VQTNAGTDDTEQTMQIRITIGEQRFTATLEGSAAARIAQLDGPVTAAVEAG